MNQRNTPKYFYYLQKAVVVSPIKINSAKPKVYKDVYFNDNLVLFEYNIGEFSTPLSVDIYLSSTRTSAMKKERWCGYFILGPLKIY